MSSDKEQDNSTEEKQGAEHTKKAEATIREEAPNVAESNDSDPQKETAPEDDNKLTSESTELKDKGLKKFLPLKSKKLTKEQIGKNKKAIKKAKNYRNTLVKFSLKYSKNPSVIMSVVTFILTVIASFYIFHLFNQPEPPKGIGIAEELAFKVFITRYGEDKPVELMPTHHIGNGDKIETNETGSVKIKFHKDDSILEISSSSDLNIYYNEIKSIVLNNGYLVYACIGRDNPTMLKTALFSVELSNCIIKVDLNEGEAKITSLKGSFTIKSLLDQKKHELKETDSIVVKR